MSLSTFSAHIANVVSILRAATDRSLVLVDELASGTDPAEGAALAQAVLTQLARQARLTVVTTHYPELKEWASATDGAANAATGLDAETHEPLYRSPSAVRARRTRCRPPSASASTSRSSRTRARRVAPERLRIAELLAEAEAAERHAASRERGGREREEARGSASGAHGARPLSRREIQEVRASAAQAREQAIAEAERDLAEARAELAGAARGDPRARRRRAARQAHTHRGAREAESERDRRLSAASDARRAHRARAARSATSRCALTAPLAVGDPVDAPALGLRGTIADDRRRRGGGDRRQRAARPHRARPAAAGRASGRPRDAPEPAVKVLASARGDVSDELDVRGQPRAGGARGGPLLRRRRRARGPAAGARRARPRHRRGSDRRARRARGHPLVDGRETRLGRRRDPRAPRPLGGG